MKTANNGWGQSHESDAELESKSVKSGKKFSNQFKEIDFNSLMVFHKESLPFDLHIHLGGPKITQIFRKGQAVDIMRLVNYRKKGASSFLFPKEQSRDYLQGASSLLHKKTLRAELNTNSIHSLMMDVTKYLFKDVREHQIVDSSVYQVIEGLVNSYIVMVHFDFPSVLNLIGMAQGRGAFLAHAVSTSFFSILLGHEMKLNPHLLKSLGQGGLLHDIGLLHLPSDFNEFSSNLSLREKVELQNHSARGLELLEASNKTPERLRKIILEHHEHWDGSGFPKGLRQEQIHPLARMIAIADSFCHHLQQSNLGSESLNPILKLMQEQGHFDPDFLELFGKTLRSKS